MKITFFWENGFSQGYFAFTKLGFTSVWGLSNKVNLWKSWATVIFHLWNEKGWFLSVEEVSSWFIICMIWEIQVSRSPLVRRLLFRPLMSHRHPQPFTQATLHPPPPPLTPLASLPRTHPPPFLPETQRAHLPSSLPAAPLSHHEWSPPAPPPYLPPQTPPPFSQATTLPSPSPLTAPP